MSEELKAFRVITVDASAEDLLEAWCDPLVQVKVAAPAATLKEARGSDSEWTVHLPLDRTMEARVHLVEKDQQSAHHLISSTHIQVEAFVHASPAPQGYGTEVALRVAARLPGGKLAEHVSGWFDSPPALLVAHVLRKFKALMETGEVPTLEKNPAHRRESSPREPA